MINRERLINTFCELVKIDSPSGEEEVIRSLLEKKLTDVGLDTLIDDYGNLIAKKDGPNPILLSAHMDTVEPGRNIKPSIKKDRIISDGTTILGGDCKAGVSAIIEAVESFHEDGLDFPPLEIVLTREEEIGLVGARNLDFSLIHSKLAIVFDGEGPVSQITSSSPSYVGFDMAIKGISAHAGAEPEKGLSAIKIAGDLISELPQGRLDKNTTFNIGTIEGGSVRNTVAENVNIKGEFRSTNIENLDEIRNQIDIILNKIRNKYPESEITNHLHVEFETYNISDNEPALLTIKAALNSLGLPIEMKASGGGTDGNVFRLNGISAVVVGMADHGMHTVREYVTIPDLIDAAHVCETLLRSK
jgi:tripeptide aminopeptidase